jgi:citrate lyase subunit beta/citryl-CoA lyase
MDAEVYRAAPRRSCLVVPGDQPKLVAGAGRFGAAQIVFDLADVEPSSKDIARAGVAEALEANDYREALVTVRVNPIASMWAYRDVVDVVEAAGEFLDGVAVPHVASPADIEFAATLIGMIEQRIDLGHQIDIEAEIATPQAVMLLDELAVASDRLDTLVLDEAAVSAALGVEGPAASVVLTPLRVQVLLTARAAGVLAVLAPDVEHGDWEGFAPLARDMRALGYDGIRCGHPTQVTVANAAWEDPDRG